MFSFEGVMDKPEQGWLQLKPDANIAWLYIENSPIKIDAVYELASTQDGLPYRVLSIQNVTGSTSYSIQKEYRSFYQANKDKEDFNTLLYNKL